MSEVNKKEDAWFNIVLVVVMIVMAAGGIWYYTYKKEQCKDGVLVRGVVGYECMR